MSNPIDQAKTPFLAAIGAGDYALASVTEAVMNARSRALTVRSRAEERAESTRGRVADFPEEFNAQLNELRTKLDPEELRRVADAYVQAAAGIYVSLAERGDEVIAKVRKQPQVEDAIERAEDAAEDARGLTTEVLGTVARQTRSIGEKAARATERVTGRTASAVTEAGAETAHQLRSTSRKAANQTSPPKAAAHTKPAPAKKPTAARKTVASKTVASKAADTAAAAVKSVSKAADTASAVAKTATETKDTAVKAQSTATAKTSDS
ncbi:MAG: heparin-binding hemagglutinin [Mycobacteriaceae bacterium]